MQSPEFPEAGTDRYRLAFSEHADSLADDIETTVSSDGRHLSFNVGELIDAIDIYELDRLRKVKVIIFADEPSLANDSEPETKHMIAFAGGAMHFLPDSGTVAVGINEHLLGPRIRSIFEILAVNIGHLVTRDELKTAWPDEFQPISHQDLDKGVARVRAKLTAIGEGIPGDKLITRVTGLGYRLETDIGHSPERSRGLPFADAKLFLDLEDQLLVSECKTKRLTKQELNILTPLVSNPDTTISADDLLGDPDRALTTEERKVARKKIYRVVSNLQDYLNTIAPGLGNEKTGALQIVRGRGYRVPSRWRETNDGRLPHDAVQLLAGIVMFSAVERRLFTELREVDLSEYQSTALTLLTAKPGEFVSHKEFRAAIDHAALPSGSREAQLDRYNHVIIALRKKLNLAYAESGDTTRGIIAAGILGKGYRLRATDEQLPYLNGNQPKDDRSIR